MSGPMQTREQHLPFLTPTSSIDFNALYFISCAPGFAIKKMLLLTSDVNNLVVRSKNTFRKYLSGFLQVLSIVTSSNQQN